MSTSKELVERILDALIPLDVRTRAMFGAYGLYCDEKFVGLINGEHLYIKRSDVDPTFLNGTEPAPPFPGAKDWHRVPDRLIDEGEWLRDAIQETASALPLPKPKRRGVASRQSEDGEWLDGPPEHDW
ncbi:MAG TPA: TfoX/Sxy family protein [Thermomicrobiales bacterium]|nr:TfoX/Sxy family protein [Thermomicrobiales bacterium]